MGFSSAYNLKHPVTRLLASHHRAGIHRINRAEQHKMSRNTSASNPEEKPPPYSVIAPRLDRPGRHGLQSDSYPSRRYRTLLPSFEKPPPYSRESKGSKRLLTRYEKLSPHAPYTHRFIRRLPADTATASGVRNFLRFLFDAKRKISEDDAWEIAALWTASKGYELRTYSKLERVIWDDLDSCLENDQMRSQRYAANSRIVIIGSWHPADIICSLHMAGIYTRQSSKATGLTAASIVMLTALIILLLYLTSRIGARTAVICQVCLAVALVVIIATWCYQANNVGERGKE